MSTTVPTVSRAFDGPSSGSSTNGPSPTPQTAKVWPKSALCGGIQFIRHIENPGHSGGRIDREPLNRLPGLLDIPLQCVVHRDRGFLEVLHDIVNALLHAFRHVVGIRLGDRLHDRMIGSDIGLEDRSVDRLGRIVLGVGIIR